MVDQTEPDGDTKAPVTEWMLRAETGPLAGKLFPLPLLTRIGRALECGISIPEGGLSREHAELVIEANQLIVRDLDSSNGTFWNGDRVAEARPKHGDLVAFDQMRFRVIGPANDMDRTIISVGAPRPKPKPAAAGPTPAAPAAAAMSMPPRRPAPPPPPKSGVPAWIVLVAIAAVVAVVVLLTV